MPTCHIKLARLAIALVVAGATACGTTLPRSDFAAKPGQPAAGNDGLSVGQGSQAEVAALGDTTGGDTTGGGAGSSADNGGTTDLGSGGPSTTDTTVGDAANGAGTMVTPTAMPTPASGAPQITSSTPISVGIMTLKNTQGVTALASFADVPAVNPVSDYGTIINWANAHGGFAGHRIVPVYFQFDVVSEDYSDEEQAACAAFTQDHHVQFVLSDRDISDGLLPTCLSKKNVPIIFDFPGFYDHSLFTRFPGYIYAPNQADTETILYNWMLELQRNGYFDKGSKIGVLYPGGGQAVINSTLLPTLKAMGQTPVSLISYTTVSVEAGAAGDVLQFKAAGVNHLIVMDSTGFGATLLIMLDAQTQDWFPRYALNSANSMDFLRHNVPPQQLTGSLGISWIPSEDLGPSAQPPDSANTSQCLSVDRAAGIAAPDQTTKGVLTWFCGLVLFFQTAMNHAPAATLAGLRAGIASLGDSWVAPHEGTTHFGPGVFAGGSGYYDMGYNQADGYYTRVDPGEHTMLRPPSETP